MAILLINGFYKNHDFSKFDLNYFKQVLDSSSIASESNKKINKKKKTIIKPREFRTKIRNKLEVVFNGFFKKKFDFNLSIFYLLIRKKQQIPNNITYQLDV